MSRGSGGCGWRARCARHRAITTEQRHHAACDRRAARPIGPARWAGRHPLMSPSEHMRLRVSAPPRLVISHRRAPWTGLGRHGSSAPRCVVDSVRSGPAADPLNKYLPISKNAWELGVGGWALTRFDNLSRRLSGDFVPIRNTRWLSTGVRMARPARECGADDRLPPRRPRSHHAMARLSCHAVRPTRLEWTGL